MRVWVVWVYVLVGECVGAVHVCGGYGCVCLCACGDMGVCWGVCVGGGYRFGCVCVWWEYGCMC